MFICGFLLASTVLDDHWRRRLSRASKFGFVLQLVLAASCRGFFSNLASSTSRHAYYQQAQIGISKTLFIIDRHSSTISSQACPNQQHQQQQQQHYLSSLSSSSNTRLYGSSSNRQQQQQQQQRKTRPPRFVQKAHANDKKNAKALPKDDMDIDHSRSSRPARKRGPLPPGVPVDVWNANGRSIEELEEVMLKRWGTIDQSPPSTPRQNRRNGNQKGKTNPFQRPVVDPWASTTTTTSSSISSPQENNDYSIDFGVREFYDEDDEGFEIMEFDENDAGVDEWDDDDTSTDIRKGAASRMKISHLISPKPVGGQGTSQIEADKSITSSKSYFFNPNKQIKPVPESTTTRRLKNGASDGESADPSKSNESSIKPKKKERAPPSKPVLDYDGNPILLTVEEALSQFQSSTDEEAVAAMISDDEAEAPMVAYQQQQQQFHDDDDVASKAPASWTDIGITSEIVLENLDAMYCSAPLSVQEKAIPAVLTANDVLVGTYTGSGKTLAFLAPLIQRLLWSNDDDPGLAVLIVAPGRELASQIVSVARQLLEDTSLRVQLAIGGTTFSRNLEQIRKRKPNIIVGTPGRIAELVVGKPGEKSGKLKIGDLQSLVLDEFDALLEYKPHREPTRAILQSLQRRHGDTLQSILCSATASDLMHSPKVTEYLRPGFATAMADEDDVFVTSTSTQSSKSKPRPQVSRTVMHGVVHVEHRRFALDTIRRILHTDPIPQQILIFVESARKVDIVVDKLSERGIIAAPLHGGQGSDKMDRAEVSKALREGYVGIVVATELAARGLDAPFLTHVINMDLPTDASHYAHRAGRCGRGGRPGVVINVTTSPKERNVPLRFAQSLGIEMHTVEPRKGKLVVVEPDTQTVDA